MDVTLPPPSRRSLLGHVSHLGIPRNWDVVFRMSVSEMTINCDKILGLQCWWGPFLNFASILPTTLSQKVTKSSFFQTVHTYNHHLHFLTSFCRFCLQSQPFWGSSQAYSSKLYLLQYHDSKYPDVLQPHRSTRPSYLHWRGRSWSYSTFSYWAWCYRHYLAIKWRSKVWSDWRFWQSSFEFCQNLIALSMKHHYIDELWYLHVYATSGSGSPCCAHNCRFFQCPFHYGHKSSTYSYKVCRIFRNRRNFIGISSKIHYWLRC